MIYGVFIQFRNVNSGFSVSLENPIFFYLAFVELFVRYMNDLDISVNAHRSSLCLRHRIRAFFVCFAISLIELNSPFKRSKFAERLFVTRKMLKFINQRSQRRIFIFSRHLSQTDKWITILLLLIICISISLPLATLTTIHLRPHFIDGIRIWNYPDPLAVNFEWYVCAVRVCVCFEFSSSKTEVNWVSSGACP